MKYKRHVLIIIPHLSIGGTEIQTLNLVKALIAGGCEVSVLCLFRNLPQVVALYKKVGAILHISNAHYSNTEVVIDYPKRLDLVRFLYKQLKEVGVRRFGYIHVQYMTPASSIITLLYYIFGCKNIIATAHTAADIYPSLKLVHFIQRHCLRAFTCITQLAEESFFGSSQLYTPQTKLARHNHFTIYNALSSHIKIRADRRVFADAITIGVVSRLEDIKGMDLVVPAFAQVHQNYPTTKLLIVGDGSQRDLMERQAEELKITNNIEFVGRQNQDTLEGYYDRIDILLMPSRSEGFGLTAIEGMARGCVVVASNVGGLPEVVVDGEVGLLHASEDVDSISDNIIKLLNDRELLERLSVKATKYVTRFQFENYSLLFNDLYKKL